MEFDKSVTPTSVEEGKKYCKYFTSQMLERNLSFHKDKSIPNQFLFVSPPRSGSNLVKARLEELYGFFIADVCPWNPLGEFLANKGACNCTLGHCQIIKTHYPHMDTTTRLRVSFPVKKAVILTRNPCNYAISLFNLIATLTHDEKLNPESYKDKPFFLDFIKALAKQYKEFHEYWFTETRVLKFFVRFEDYVVEPKETLKKILCFLDGTTVMRPVMAERLDLMEKNNDFFSSPYISKGQKVVSSKQDAFSIIQPEHMEVLANVNKEVLSRLGYVSFLKTKYPALRYRTDWNDEEGMKWLKKNNEEAMELTLSTSADRLPEFIIKKPGLRFEDFKPIIPVLLNCKSIYIAYLPWVARFLFSTLIRLMLLVLLLGLLLAWHFEYFEPQTNQLF